MRILVIGLATALLSSVPVAALEPYDIVVLDNFDDSFDDSCNWILPNLADLTTVKSAQVTGACKLAHDSFMEHINQSAFNANALAKLDFRQSKRP